ncbi:SDR family NAD(P)-dependent oxidoreductase [Terriglobus roseus]|uniref:NAD(P)-dependent dehydrogenase, short-chain alcohol dehydrogenase family n=1 Tax=Terriglobus roseus TaxID=392734 RepID=A0A1G7Q6H5_9BACT|nr:SDR family NAD(P)-dependent oxidoreductase [Terriglobus roseus]SDF94055.1 NAD(P)-dependent dehydrogenase, short-chain alcohol dehydrogenase family [Terriglobus roseus]
METATLAIYPSLRNRSVIVSGGASGIGESIVEAFAAQGARVAFLDIQDEAGHALIERIVSAGHAKPTYYHCDLSDIAALRSVATQIEQAHGTVDVLVNNAGNDTRHRIEDVTPEMWDAAMQVNLRHQFFLSQAVLPSMQHQKRGSIINLSSISWMIPSTGLPAYVTAKAAIVGLTRTLAHEVGKDNIRVNAVLPGAILTERQKRLWMTPEYTAEVMSRQALKRHLYADDVARTVLFLAADDSSAITNQSLVVDGGWV